MLKQSSKRKPGPPADADFETSPSRRARVKTRVHAENVEVVFARRETLKHEIIKERRRRYEALKQKRLNLTLGNVCGNLKSGQGKEESVSL